MRLLVGMVAAIVTLIAGVTQAFAYTLLLDVKENSLDIKQAPMKNDTLFGYGDLTIEFETKGMAGRQWRLSILAIDDLRGTSSVPATEVSWNALSRNLYDGKLVKGVPQVLAEGTGDQKMVSRLRFFFKGGDYEAGFYDSQIRFILSVP